MVEFFTSLPSYGFFLTMGVYIFAMWISKKVKSPLANPLLIGSILIVILLLLFNIEVTEYQDSSYFINYLLTPATISLAIPVYKNISILKDNLKEILISCTVGMVAGIISILLVALVFQMDSYMLKSVLAKSVTTAIAMDITEIIGGNVSIIVGSVVLTGIYGVVICDVIFKLFKINSPFARGLALGASSHAMGTAESVSRNDIQGAMSSLAMVVCGILIAILVPVTANVLGI